MSREESPKAEDYYDVRFEAGMKKAMSVRKKMGDVKPSLESPSTQPPTPPAAATDLNWTERDSYMDFVMEKKRFFGFLRSSSRLFRRHDTDVV